MVESIAIEVCLCVHVGVHCIGENIRKAQPSNQERNSGCRKLREKRGDGQRRYVSASPGGTTKTERMSAVSPHALGNIIMAWSSWKEVNLGSGPA
jgi:hypothetical protein